MELIDVLQQIAQSSQRAMQPAELQIGTVVSEAPLEISVNAAMAPLKAEVLHLTESVVEKKIPALSHSHQTGGLSHSHTAKEGSTSASLSGSYPSDARLTGIACIEHGVKLPAENGYIILNRRLQAGDKVLLLQVRHGQEFIVLSRLF